MSVSPPIAVCTFLALLFATANFAPAQNLPCLLGANPRDFDIRDPAELAPIALPDLPPPATVTEPQDEAPQRVLTLDEAIHIALANAQVVRVLAGVTSASSGRTVYDTAIARNEIAQQQARFDPAIDIGNTWNRLEPPDLLDPRGGTRTDQYRFDLGLSKTTTSGGTARLGLNTDSQRFGPGTFLLNPQTNSSLDLSYIQPLLQGGGRAVNLAPIVLARIDTERSYFQFKDSVQELVRGVIEGYWTLVAARTDWWARQQQLEQATFAFELTQAKFDAHIVDMGPLAQTRVSLGNFRSSVLSARQNLLEREAALRSVLGLPPSDNSRLVPVTAPAVERIEFPWQAVLELAAQQRPDLIELKLILEADQQLLLQARNQARPRLDAVGLYRWNGLEGELPSGERIGTQPGQFTDWSLGVNFSVPLGLRRERAVLRNQELLIARDRANLDQELHRVAHTLAQSLRVLAEAYEQYQIARQTREAARVNLNVQMENYLGGRTQYINVLLAINDWGNAISFEAQHLTRYNAELASLERQTGTILEAHGIRFYEERLCSLGPLGELGAGRQYPSALRPAANAPRYGGGDEPAEESFQLDNPLERRRQGPAEPLPRPQQ